MRTKSKAGFVAVGLAVLLGATVLPACAPPPEDPPPPSSGITPTSVAMMLLEKAGGVVASKGAGFVMTAMGLNELFPDGNAQQLDEIKRELDAISSKLDQVSRSLASLTGQFAQAELTAQLTALRDESRDVTTLYKEQFMPMVAAAAEHEAAKKSGDQQRIDDAFAQLIRRRNQFYVAYDRLNASSLAGKISDRLVPGEATSALSSKGLVLLTRQGGRYYTAADSAQIRALYENFAEYEALAAWMRMERWIPSDPEPPGDTKEGYLPNFENARKEYLEQTREEHAGLPPLIPADVVIDAGSGVRSMNGATMWLPVAESVRYQPGNRDPGTVPVLLDELNADTNRGYGDWTVPANTDLTALLAGFTPAPGTTPGSYLAGLNQASPKWQSIADATPWPYVWSRDTVTFQVRCYYDAPVPGPARVYTERLQNAVGTSTPTAVWGGRPALPTRLTTRTSDRRGPNCDSLLSAIYDGPTALGGMLVSRTVVTRGAMDYMGQGSGPYVRPNADLRLADLSKLYLAELDISRADLRGATFTGTDLSGADLTGADLRGARFDGTDLAGAKLAGADLRGVTSVHVEGVPASLPAGWSVIDGHLVGPGADFSGLDLSGLDLRGVDLTGVRSGGTDCTGCLLPSGWRWSGKPSGYLIHRTADLRGAVLSDLDLSGVDLTGADLTGTDFTDATLTNLILTNATITGARFGTDDDDKLAGIVSRGLVGQPAQLPASGRFRIVEGYFIGPSANLRGAHFSSTAQLGVALSGADFTGANLSGLNLAGAFLNNANLTGAVLTGANLNAANLSAATLTGVTSGGIVGTPVLPPGWKLVKGYLVGRGVDLHSVDLSGADLSGVDLTGAVLTGTNLTNATLTNVTLTGANVSGARFGTDNDNKLSGIVSGGLVGVPAQLPATGRFRVVEGYLVGPNVNLTGATFTPAAQLGISLSATNFTNANLTGLNLTGAFMNNANLTGAVLTGTNLTGVNLSAATLTGVTSGGIVGVPALPTGWTLVDGYLVGPG